MTRDFSKQSFILLRNFALHCATGALATLAHYALMWLLLRQEFNPVAASSAGFLLGAIVRFLFAHFAVFTPAQALPTTLIKYSAALAIQLAANSVLLALLVALNLPIWWAQIAVTVLLTFISYGVYRFWVFK